MSSFINGRRVFAALTVAFALLAIFDRYSDRSLVAGVDASADRPFLAAKFTGKDRVTDALRSASSVLTRINVRNDSDRKAATRVGNIVQDYGSFVLVARNEGVQAKGYGLEEQAVETTVHLPGAQFDPVRQPPAGSMRLGADAAANSEGYYILQFGGTATDEWLKSISLAGVEVLQYVSHQAYFVYGDAESIARVANHSRVRWIGQYGVDQKLRAGFKKHVDSLAKGPAMVKKRTGVFDVAVFARADLDAVAEDLRQNFGKGFFRITQLQHNYFNLVRIEMNLDDVERAAAMPDVFTIEAALTPKAEDARSAHIIAGNYLNATTLSATEYDPMTQFGTDGSAATVSVVDDGVGIPGEGGFYIHTLNTVNGPLRGASTGAMGHGHLNASIIAGSAHTSGPQPPIDGGFWNYGIGIAPRANIVSLPFLKTPGYTGDIATAYNDSISTPGVNTRPAQISNNSWGMDPGEESGNSYTGIEATYDGFVRDASSAMSFDPITLIFSAGNLGTNGLTRPKAAKNVISVGNSEGLRPELAGTNSNNIDDLASDSSRGPATDGRIKPDIVAPGTAISGGRSGVMSLGGNIDSVHRWASGTSHSAAHISGVAALFASWYRTGIFDEPTPSLIKAALINSAVDLNGQGTSAGVPNGNEGWGRPNLKNMFRTGVNIKYSNEAVTLGETGSGFEITGSVADGSKPMRVTLVWTDPPGTADPALVNNLDLTVTVGGIVYKGNVFSNGVSVSGGVADTRNNVENVFLPAGIPGGTDLRVTVTATQLNGDGVLGSGDLTDQKFSLIVYNYSNQSAPSFYQMAGKVISANGRGIGMARIVITDQSGTPREARTNPLGHFSFLNVRGGQVGVSISSKRYTFVPQTVPLSSNATNLSFMAAPGSP